MALIVKPFTFTNGTVADADEVNANFDTAYDCLNGNLDAENIDLADDYAWTGSHTFNSISAKTPGWTSNLGIKYSAGTFSICAADGTDLSSTNSAWVTVPSSTTGQLVNLQVTANPTFNDDAHATSDIAGEEFGTTAGTAWSEHRPFFIYAVNTDNTSSGLVFAISPLPMYKYTPSGATSLGYKGNPASSPSDRSMFFLLSSSPSSYISKPCTLVGSFRMQKSAADDWTVQALNVQNYGDGIGYGFEKSGLYTMPQGQMGASSSNFFLPNGGTAPAFSSRLYRYSLTRDSIHCILNFQGDGGTDGAGAVGARIVLPYDIINSSISSVASGYILSAGGVDNVLPFEFDNTVTAAFKIYTTATTELTLASFSNGNRIVMANFTLKLYE